MSHSSSSSSQMPPQATPGWNDPPTLNASQKSSSSSRLFSMKHRRPVDPSIQGYNCLSQPRSGQSPTQMFEKSMRNVTPHVAPNPASAPNLASLYISQQAAAPVEQFDGQYRSVFDAFTIASASYQHPSDFAAIHPVQVPVSSAVGLPIQQNFADLSCAPQLVSQASLSQTTYTQNVQGPSIESDPSALIYTPPNVIDEREGSRNVNNYVAPIKAAGDVSLNGLQLASFLTKATLRLAPGVTRDGIQLRIAQFQESASLNRITESCIKKLNFIIDAIDRESYEEAQQFFEQFQTLFPEETKTGWVQGLRLLIAELRRPPRGSSAGNVRHY